MTTSRKSIRKEIILFLFLIVSYNWCCAQVVWDGGGNGSSWDDPFNWVGNTAPTLLDSVVIDTAVNVTVTGLANARSVYLGPGVILSQTAKPNWKEVLEIASGAVFNLNAGDWDWEHVINGGRIEVNGFINFRDSIDVINLVSGEIEIADLRQINFVEASVDNFGLIELGSSGDLLATTGALHRLINRSGGTLRNFGPILSTVKLDITNYGYIETIESTLRLEGDNFLMDNSVLYADSSLILEFNVGTTTFEGTVLGDPEGLVRINGNYASNGGSTDFGKSGLYILGDFVGGGTLTNNGKIICFGTSCDMRDSSILVNNDSLIINIAGQINVIDGTIDNFGTLILESSSDIFTPFGNLHELINRASGLIQKFGADQSDIRADITNFGLIESLEGTLELEGDNNHEAGSLLEAALTAKINNLNGQTTFNGLVSGNSPGEVLLSADYASIGGTVNFTNSGLLITGDLVGGGTLTNAGKMTFISTGCDIRDSSILINNDTIIVDVNDQINMIDGTIDNFGTIILRSSGDIFTPSGNLHELINRNIGIIYNTGSGQSDIRADITNFGLITSLESTLELEGNNFHEASSLLQASLGASLVSQSGLSTFSGNVSGSPEGEVRLSGNYASNNGSINFSNSGLLITGDMVGGGLLTNNGKMIFFGTGCDVRDSSILVNNDTIIVDVNDQINMIDGTIDNFGHLILESSGDIFTLIGDLHELINRPSGVIYNRGASPSDIRADITNFGLIASLESTLELEGNNFHEANSSVDASAGASLVNQIGLTTFNGEVIGSPLGQVRLSGDYASNNGSISFSNAGVFITGDFVGGGTLTNKGKMTFFGTGCDIRDSSMLVNNDTIIIDVNNQINMIDGTIENDGIIQLWSSGDIFNLGGSLHEVINNTSGTIEKIGASISEIESNVKNHGTVRVVSSVFAFEGEFINKPTGRITGEGTINIANANFANSGTTAAGFSPGSLNFTGAYLQDSSGTLEVELNGVIPGTAYDQVSSSLQASVEGNLILTLGYQPAMGDSFDVITAPSFSLCSLTDTVNTCYNDEINSFSVVCTPTAARLKWIGLKPNEVACKDITVYLDQFGEFTIDPFDVLGESVELCGIDELTLADSTVTCSEVNMTVQRELTMTSLASMSSCMVNITVLDSIKPEAVSLNGLSFDLDMTGNITITADAIDGGSTDNCSVNLSIDKSTFDCSDIGLQRVVLTVTDQSGNQDTSSTLINITDVTPPEILINNPVDITIDDMSGQASLTAIMVDNGTSDACGLVMSLEISQEEFNCSSPDMVELIFTAEDEYGNIDSIPFTVNIIKPQKSVAWVNDNAIGNNNGLTPNNAYADLSMALSGMGCYTSLDTVKVIEGIYKPSNLGPLNRNSSFEIPDGITVIGGFSPGGNVFDPAVHETILDGNIGAAGSSDNSFHVVTIPSSTTSSQLNGVIIQNGNANGVLDNSGAGMLVQGKCQLHNSVIKNNQATLAGSALYIEAPLGNMSLIENNVLELNFGSSITDMDLGATLEILNTTEIK